MLSLGLPSALGDGWVVAIIVALIPIFAAVVKGVANRWRAPLAKALEENKALKEAAVMRTNELTDAKIRIMFLEAKVDYCEGELENWRSGKWQAPT